MGESQIDFNNQPDAGSQGLVTGLVIQGIVNMNTTVTSILGTAAVSVASILAGWLATAGIISPADVSTISAALGTIALGAFVFVIGYLKTLLTSKAATIAAINSHIAAGTVAVLPATATGPAIVVPTAPPLSPTKV